MGKHIIRSSHYGKQHRGDDNSYENKRNAADNGKKDRCMYYLLAVFLVLGAIETGHEHTASGS